VGIPASPDIRTIHFLGTVAKPNIAVCTWMQYTHLSPTPLLQGEGLFPLPLLLRGVRSVFHSTENGYIRPMKQNIEPILDRRIEFHVSKDLRMTGNICVRSTVDQNIQAEYLLSAP
jgi:hypothetical protein